MGKKKGELIPNKHLRSRVSYLLQAANYLSQAPFKGHKLQDVAAVDDTRRFISAVPQSPTHQGLKQGDLNAEQRLLSESTTLHDSLQGDREATKRTVGQSCRLLSHLKAISLKSQIRLSSEIKHAICRHCESLLLPGSSSTCKIENDSRGGKKPWADVLVITCDLCGTARRFPTGAERQCKRKARVEKTQGLSTSKSTR